jgi:hypothetical protein
MEISDTGFQEGEDFVEFLEDGIIRLGGVKIIMNWGCWNWWYCICIGPTIMICSRIRQPHSTNITCNH